MEYFLVAWSRFLIITLPQVFGLTIRPKPLAPCAPPSVHGAFFIFFASGKLLRFFSTIRFAFPHPII